MKLELRNIKTLQGLSEETHCYTARLYLDGKHVADVANEGHGGPDDQRWKFESARLSVDAYFRSLPPIEEYGMSLPQDLEMWCCEQVNEFLTLRDLRRQLKRKILCVENGKLYETSLKGRPITPELLAAFSAKHPEAVVLNRLKEEAALRIYRTF